MSILKGVPFTISVEGDKTGEKFFGEFKAKPFLSHGDELYRDRLRKEYLGPSPEASSQEAIERAEILSQLAVRLQDAPKWWKEARNCLDLYDSNVVFEVFSGVAKIAQEAMENVKKKADAVTPELQKSVTNT